MINTKQYDIDLNGFSEDDIINRTKAVFNKFPNVVFMCKAIGKLDEQALQEQLNSHGSSDGTQAYMEQPLQFDNEVIGDTQWDSLDSADIPPAEAGGEFVPNEWNGTSSEYQDIDTGMNGAEQSIVYLGASFGDALTVLSDENTPVYNIAAIGDNTRLFKIKNETYYDIINDSINSLLSLLKSSMNGVMNLQNTDLSLLDERIVHYNNTNEESIPLPFTSEYFVNINSVYDCVVVIIAIARMLGISEQQAFFYFNANYIKGSAYESMFIQGDMINLNRVIDYDSLEEVKQVLNCMISGVDVANMLFIQDHRSILENLVKSTMAFRRINGKGVSFKKPEDIANFIAIKFSEKLDKNNYKQAIDSINSNMYSQIIYESPDDLSNDRVEISLDDGSTYYMEPQSGYINMILLLILNRVINNDDNIEMRLDLDSKRYNVYKHNTDTSDCNVYLTGKLFIESIEGKTKVIA